MTCACCCRRSSSSSSAALLLVPGCLPSDLQQGGVVAGEPWREEQLYREMELPRWQEPSGGGGRDDMTGGDSG
ncbi:hypothetical protein NHX12_013533 [Muraenolepis orangiensis]|uniref:Secreted protein n=1 Tax=Muraenolepis orangiensis TaxID=630683 RepID=A0A9Q0I6Z6_9TELE|nr:hypothetical protein NHX12_013533 [Muraenolepis orangiensis]